MDNIEVEFADESMGNFSKDLNPPDLLNELEGASVEAPAEQDASVEEEGDSPTGEPTEVEESRGLQPEDILGLVDGRSSNRGRPPGKEKTKAAPSDSPFFSRKELSVQHKYVREQPHHRVICYLLAQGMKPGDVAEKVGLKRETITIIKAQPWAQKQIAEFIAEAGGEMVKEVMRKAALPAAEYLASIVTGEVDVGPKLRAQEANNFLDRVYGTAPQVVRQEAGNPEDMSNEELMAIIQGTKN